MGPLKNEVYILFPIYVKNVCFHEVNPLHPIKLRSKVIRRLAGRESLVKLLSPLNFIQIFSLSSFSIQLLSFDQRYQIWAI